MLQTKAAGPLPRKVLNALDNFVKVFDGLLADLPPDRVEGLRRTLLDAEAMKALCDEYFSENETSKAACQNTYEAVFTRELDETQKKALGATLNEVFRHHVSSDVRRPHLVLMFELGGLALATYFLSSAGMLKASFSFRDLLVEIEKFLQLLEHDGLFGTAFQANVGLLSRKVDDLTRLGGWQGAILAQVPAAATLQLLLDQVSEMIKSTVDDAHENRYLRSIIRGWQPLFEEKKAELHARRGFALSYGVGSVVTRVINGLLEAVPLPEGNPSSDVLNALARHYHAETKTRAQLLLELQACMRRNSEAQACQTQRAAYEQAALQAANALPTVAAGLLGERAPDLLQLQALQVRNDEECSPATDAKRALCDSLRTRIASLQAKIGRPSGVRRPGFLPPAL